MDEAEKEMLKQFGDGNRTGFGSLGTHHGCGLA